MEIYTCDERRQATASQGADSNNLPLTLIRVERSHKHHLEFAEHHMRPVGTFNPELAEILVDVWRQTNALRVPLKTIQERLRHALSGSLTLDVYTHAEWPENVEAAKLAGEKIETAVNSVSLTANQEKGPLAGAPEALAA